MNVWFYLRGATVVASFAGGLFGKGRPVDFGFPLLYLAAAFFGFSAVGMLFVIGIRALNSHSDAVWKYPAWMLNPFRLGQPLQFFHWGGYLFLAAGVGALIRTTITGDTRLTEPVVFTACGAGALFGVWCCTRIFRKKMECTQSLVS